MTLGKKGLMRAQFWTFLKDIIALKQDICHTSRNVLSLRPQQNKQCIIPRNKVISGKPSCGSKS